MRKDFLIRISLNIHQEVPQAGIEPTTLALGVLCSVR
jgi:hypothetical protein